MRSEEKDIHLSQEAWYFLWEDCAQELDLTGFDLSRVNSQGYGALLYAAFVGTFAGMMLAFHNIQRFGATASAITGYIIPLVATVGGVLLLDETITPGMILGMAFIVGGVAIINQRAPDVQQQATTPPG